RRRHGAKVGRNDPCPCGSGRRYEQCHRRHRLHHIQLERRLVRRRQAVVRQDREVVEPAILQGKDTDPTVLPYESGAILLIPSLHEDQLQRVQRDRA
ncbi:MAG: SEC-C metal-binding domain-containing protein, partial [Proteobacteria bacterium]|nr:SEC-C metal-binding domain-containing protein [Pseudomonadota bacterium]